MLSSSLYALLKLSKTTFPQKLLSSDYITLYGVNCICLGMTGLEMELGRSMEEEDEDHADEIKEVMEVSLQGLLPFSLFCISV